MTLDQKITVLLSYGFVVGKRDPKVKPAYPGQFMVRENAEDTEDDWAVVGDDMTALVNEAFDLAHQFSHFDRVCKDVMAGGDGVLRIMDPMTRRNPASKGGSTMPKAPLLSVVDGDAGEIDEYGKARTRLGAMRVASRYFADPVVDAYVAHNIRLPDGRVLAQAWVAVTGHGPD